MISATATPAKRCAILSPGGEGDMASAGPAQDPHSWCNS